MWSTNDPEWGIVATPVVSPRQEDAVRRRRGTATARQDCATCSTRSICRRERIDCRRSTIGVAANSTPNPCTAQNAFNPCMQKQRPALLLGRRRDVRGLRRATAIGARCSPWTPQPDAASVLERDADRHRRRHLAIRAGAIGRCAGQRLRDDRQRDIQRGPTGSNYGNSVVKLRLEGSTLVGEGLLHAVQLRIPEQPRSRSRIRRARAAAGDAAPHHRRRQGRRAVRRSGGEHGQTCGGHHRAGLPEHQHRPAGPRVRGDDAGTGRSITATSTDRRCSGTDPTWRGSTRGARTAGSRRTRSARDDCRTSANPKMSAFQPPHGMPGGMLALSANGRTAGTGILWAVVPLDGDANEQRGVKGIVLALDAQDVSRTLWTSEQIAGRDRLGLFAKFNPPLVADGKVFVATYGDNEPRQTYGGNSRPTTFPKYYVAVYGLLPAAAPAPVVDQSRDDVTVVRASTSPLALEHEPVHGHRRRVGGLHGRADAGRGRHAGVPPRRPCSGTGSRGCARRARHDRQQGRRRWRMRPASASGARRPPMATSRRRTRAGSSHKAALKPTGSATLRNGAPATLHEFVGVTNCPLGQGSVHGPALQTLHAIRGGAGWPDLPKLGSRRELPGQTRRITQFDRSADVLRRAAQERVWPIAVGCRPAAARDASGDARRWTSHRRRCCSGSSRRIARSRSAAADMFLAGYGFVWLPPPSRADQGASASATTSTIASIWAGRESRRCTAPKTV